jgi:zinc/manganese transport system substrate-binding protein
MTRVLLVLVATLALCQPAVAQKLKVVATFSIIGDMVERVAGDRVELTILVGSDADAHVFEATPADARAFASADLVFESGLGFEPWVARLRHVTKAKTKTITLSQGVKALRPRQHDLDPHAWQDAGNAAIYVENLARALIAADAANAATYKKNSDAYLKELRALDRDIRTAFGKIPRAERRVIATHRAFAYLAAAYDVEVIAPLGLSTDEQPSAKAVANLIARIKREKIRAVFVENITDPRLIEQIARETGAKIGGKLYSDALSTKAGPAPTYIAMMRHNVRLLTAAMAPGL